MSAVYTYVLVKSVVDIFIIMLKSNVYNHGRHFREQTLINFYYYYGYYYYY